MLNGILRIRYVKQVAAMPEERCNYDCSPRGIVRHCLRDAGLRIGKGMTSKARTLDRLELLAERYNRLFVRLTEKQIATQREKALIISHGYTPKKYFTKRCAMLSLKAAIAHSKAMEIDARIMTVKTIKSPLLVTSTVTMTITKETSYYSINATYSIFNGKLCVNNLVAFNLPVCKDWFIGQGI